jgi:hypothetical protein
MHVQRHESDPPMSPDNIAVLALLLAAGLMTIAVIRNSAKP